MIVDASVLLHAFLPDELQPNALTVVREHVSGRLQLKAPVLLLYDICYAIWQAERSGRINREQANRIIDPLPTSMMSIFTTQSKTSWIGCYGWATTNMNNMQTCGIGW